MIHLLTGKAAILLHWIFTVALILGSSTSDTYTFVTNIFIYSGNWIKRKFTHLSQAMALLLTVDAVFLGGGLLYLTFKTSENWRDQRTTFKNYPLLTIFWMFSLLFSVAAPFIPNTQVASIPFWVVPTLGTSMLFIGTVYWILWAKVAPALGFHIQHEVILLPDGSERVRYIVSLRLGP
jgi:hypothetical protein